MLDFLTHLERARGLTHNTREAYRVDLLQFGAFLARRGVGALAADHTTVAAFLEELIGDRTTPPAAATLRRKAACLRSFYGYLHMGRTSEPADIVRTFLRDSSPFGGDSVGPWGLLAVIWPCGHALRRSMGLARWSD